VTLTAFHSGSLPDPEAPTSITFEPSRSGTRALKVRPDTWAEPPTTRTLAPSGATRPCTSTVDS
jgi:hypothetical protein